MLLLNRKDLTGAFTLPMVITTVEQAFQDYHKGDLRVPGRLTAKYVDPKGSSLILPSLHTVQPFYGLKQASVFPANLDKGLPSGLSQYFLYSAETGELLALLDFVDLTNYKTAATAAIATKHLARSDACVLSIFGAGVLSRAVLAAVMEVRPIENVRIFDLSRERAECLVSWAQENLKEMVHYQLSTSQAECLFDTDIICTCTTSLSPVFEGSLLPAGCHLNAMGSWRPEMQEIDALTVQRAGKIYCDVIADTWQEAGDLITPRDAGLIDTNVIHGELGALLTGELSGRETSDEITMYESVGFGALDLSVAVGAYRASKAAGVGLKADW
jgi:ornithine cyclodeaminase/alanine dehydrogenase-like protein (mu-crystallin family)